MTDAKKYSIMEWMREPDNVESPSLDWLTDWINRRPIEDLERIEEQAWRYRDLCK